MPSGANTSYLRPRRKRQPEAARLLDEGGKRTMLLPELEVVGQHVGQPGRVGHEMEDAHVLLVILGEGGDKVGHPVLERE
jgi:hypothetical protein